MRSTYSVLSGCRTHRNVVGNLAKLASGIGICIQQYVEIWFDKDANRQILDP